MEPDSLLHPIGPLPEVTYWRRRVAAVGALAVTVLLAGHAVAGGDSGPKRATVAASSLSSSTGRPAVADPTPTASPTATAAASADAAAVADAPPATAPAATPDAVADCPDAALTVTSTTDKPAYSVGSAVRLTLGVRNTGTVACRRDLGAGAVGLVVTSGSDRVWSSNDCGQRGASVVTLAPGESRAVQTTWAGLRSKPGCPGQQPSSPAGTYRVSGRVGPLTVPGAVFRLS